MMIANMRLTKGSRFKKGLRIVLRPEEKRFLGHRIGDYLLVTCEQEGAVTIRRVRPDDLRRRHQPGSQPIDQRASPNGHAEPNSTAAQ